MLKLNRLDTIYLNDGDMGIVTSVVENGYESTMASSGKYISHQSNGRFVSVFGIGSLENPLSIDWEKTESVIKK